MKLWALFALACLTSAPCPAQDVTLTDWPSERMGTGITTWTHPSRSAAVSLHELPRNANLGRMVAVLRQSLAARCPSLMRATGIPALQGRAEQVRSADNGQTCIIVYGSTATTQAIVISVEDNGGGLKASERAQALLVSTLGLGDAAAREEARAVASGAGGQSPVTKGVAGAAVPVYAASDDAMRRTIASVPRANRPRFLFDRFVMRMVGTNLIRVNDIWMAFDNGVATNCFDWNPATTAATPATLGGKPECAVARWEARSNGTYRVLDKDGATEDPLTATSWRPFRSGERIAIDFDSWDARGGPTAGAMPYASVTINELVLHTDGRFGSAEQNQRWVTGTQTTSSTSATGRYYVDGFMMAVQRPDGVVSLHFTGYQLMEGRLRLVVLNGRQYSPK